MEWLVLTILFLIIALIAGAIADIIGFLLEHRDENHK